MLLGGGFQLHCHSFAVRMQRRGIEFAEAIDPQGDEKGHSQQLRFVAVTTITRQSFD